MKTSKTVLIGVISAALCIGLLGKNLRNTFTAANPYSVQDQLHHEYYFNLYGVEVVDNPDVEKTYPEWAIPDETQSITSLEYRKSVLPFLEDHNEDGYIVYPKHGIIVPILTPSKEDEEKINTGKTFNHYPYLEEGALHYRGKNPEQGKGNMVIAAHSSFSKDEPGTYKTVFQALPISTSGDKIFVYLKNKSKEYDLYTYEIFDSFRTDIKNVKILSQKTTQAKKELTTYGCYGIGTNAERRVNKSKLIKTETNITATGKSKKENMLTTIDTGDTGNTLGNTKNEIQGEKNNKILDSKNKKSKAKKIVKNHIKESESKSIRNNKKPQPNTVSENKSKNKIHKKSEKEVVSKKESHGKEKKKIIEYSRNKELLPDNKLPFVESILKEILLKIKTTSGLEIDKVLTLLERKITQEDLHLSKKEERIREIYKALHFELSKNEEYIK